MSRISVALLLSCAAAFANNRHFGYTYETATMAKGALELEVWSTARMGHSDYYSRLDHRMEFETGLTDNLQTSFYLNWSEVTSEDGTGGLATSFDWKGISSEWKYKFSDPSADAVGFALYGELGYNTDEVELEAKTLFDKRVGDFLMAANLVGELVYEAEPADWDLHEIEFEEDVSMSYGFTSAFSAGLELRNHSNFTRDPAGKNLEFEYSALFLGPTMAYQTNNWWVTITVLPQLPGIKTTGGIQELGDHEKLEARLLFSVHL